MKTTASGVVLVDGVRSVTFPLPQSSSAHILAGRDVTVAALANTVQAHASCGRAVTDHCCQ